ncbi:tRNA epoxyqueuosine(34) reductase QueG [candidate division WOR-3 bacterium]|uniref:tRNA epoxyqueuosine(34) reductase QueG n=1 Tax=candidate division WOR-3 bacterium TaxID=2052148 RepID=A0A660SIP5_UNCW3|nr:MAG: tRNA epoxyqueuosine(34) reductase QueG [candidate division WOR-3 bacterium]
MIRNEEIKQLAPIFGIDAIGITSAEDLIDARRLRVAYRGFPSYHPRSFLKKARSVIVGIENYYARGRPLRPEEGEIARYTWSNYYYDLRTRLKELARFLKRAYQMRFRVFSNGPLAEKPLAVKAGIGYYGKHTIIINEKFGSWIVIGEILTDLEIEPDQPEENDCGDCRICIDACPTRAIEKPYQLNWKRCIQYLSNHRVEIPLEIRRVWGNRLYGCTTCQEVCPKNSRSRPTHSIPEYGYVGPGFSLYEVLMLDEERYRRRFGSNQIGARWMELACLKRNAILALVNRGEKSALNHIIRFEDDPDPMLKEIARWAVEELQRWI